MKHIRIKPFTCFCIVAILIFFYKYSNDVPICNVQLQIEKLKLKHVLVWTSPDSVPFTYMGEGQQVFKKRNCTFTNCFITSNRRYLNDYTRFDVIAFGGREVRYMNKRSFFNSLPTERSPHQKYLFVSTESADNYPMCTDTLNDFFNWTWTYRLDSDLNWRYFVIRDFENKVIGPKKDMQWMQYEEMDSVCNSFKEKLRTKTKAAAWFVSNCKSRNEREKFVEDLKNELAKYDLEIDIYGKCGSMECPRSMERHCNKVIEKDYYFYLAFENSFAEDYVTEKLLYPLKNYAIPIVYGSANYTRFMPDSIYLNAKELGPERLAKKMQELVDNIDAYAEYFRWRNHYSFTSHDKNEEDEYCRFCAFLNQEDKVRTTAVYKNFQEWWDPPNRC